jgi:hypothetical protein
MSDIPFHHASVLEAMLDLIEDGEGGRMTVEWAVRLADYRRHDRHGALPFVVRARSGAQSKVVSSDLWMAVRKWSTLDAPQADFIYHSEAPLYPTAVTIVAERLERFAEGTPTEDDRRAIRVIGVLPDAPCLRRVHLRTRSGPVNDMLAGIRWRVKRLIEPHPNTEVDAVPGIVQRLLECCSPERREETTLTQGEACEAIGVSLDQLFEDSAWNPSRLGGYLSALLGDEGPVAGDWFSSTVVPSGHPSSLPGEPLTDVLSHSLGAAVLGPAGDGMTASINALIRSAADAGAVPFVIEVRNYRYRGLVLLVRRRLESLEGRPVSAAAARRFLALPGLVLLLDGTLASVDSEAALIQDLGIVQARNPSVRVVALGMGGRQAAALGLPLFRLQSSQRAVPDGLSSTAPD